MSRVRVRVREAEVWVISVLRMKGASRCINDVIRRISPTLKMSDMSREESYDLLKWARCRQTLYSLLNLEPLSLLLAPSFLYIDFFFFSFYFFHIKYRYTHKIKKKKKHFFLIPFSDVDSVFFLLIFLFIPHFCISRGFKFKDTRFVFFGEEKMHVIRVAS